VEDWFCKNSGQISLGRAGYSIPLLDGFNLGWDIKNLRSLAVKQTNKHPCLCCFQPEGKLDTLEAPSASNQLDPRLKLVDVFLDFEEMGDTPQKRNKP